MCLLFILAHTGFSGPTEVFVDPGANNRQSIIYIMLFVGIIILVFYSFRQQAVTIEDITIGQVAQEIKSGKLTRVRVNED